MHEKQIGPYRLTSQQLGKGSFSTVYLGYTAKAEKVAVKVIPRQKIEQSQVKVFLNEINLLKKCQSPHIVRFIDLQKTRLNYYIFLEFCNEGNLEEYIKERETLTEDQAMELFKQLVKGMNSMKKLEIIHRDIKPANIMFHNGKVKYVDFGLATKFHDGGSHMLQTFAGSPFNMAPEIISRRPYNEKVDIYSLGTVLYEMLYGVRPFQGSNFDNLLQNIQNKRFNNNPKHKIKINSLLKDILKKMLNPKPEKRCSYTELVELISKYEKYIKDKTVNIYKDSLKNTRRFDFTYGGLAAPLLGMYVPFGRAIWEKAYENLYKDQVLTNKKGLFDPYKEDKPFRKNPWDLDLRVCCNLYRELQNSITSKQLV